jgi:hypothetical protein
MQSGIGRKFVSTLVSLTLISIGFVQPAAADLIGTQEMLDVEMRQAAITKVELLLARQDVAKQLQAFGVPPQSVIERVNNMTNAELLALEGQIDEQVAGGDALAVVGIVFVVLLILEIVGVTDIFKSV